MNNPAGLGGKSGKKADIDNVGNSDVIKDTRKRSNKDPERVIARLKRDKDDTDLPAETRDKANAKRLKPKIIQTWIWSRSTTCPLPRYPVTLRSAKGSRKP